LGRRARATAARPRRRGATAPSRVRCHPVRVKCWFRKRARRASSETSVSSRARRTVRGAARRGAREGTIRIGGCRRRPRGWRRGARGRAPSSTRSFAVRAAAVRPTTIKSLPRRRLGAHSPRQERKSRLPTTRRRLLRPSLLSHWFPYDPVRVVNADP
jgi:hypothetical protein